MPTSSNGSSSTDISRRPRRSALLSRPPSTIATARRQAASLSRATRRPPAASWCRALQARPTFISAQDHGRGADLLLQPRHRQARLGRASGHFICATDAGASGSDANWTHFNGSGIRLTTASDQVLIGFTSTSTLSKLEVVGGAAFDTATATNFAVLNQSYFAGNVGIGSTSPTQKLTVAGGTILQTAGTAAISTSTTVGGSTYGVYTSGNYAYVAGGNVRILDITQPQNPVLVGSYHGHQPVAERRRLGQICVRRRLERRPGGARCFKPLQPPESRCARLGRPPAGAGALGSLSHRARLRHRQRERRRYRQPGYPDRSLAVHHCGAPSGAAASVAVSGKYVYVGSNNDGSIDVHDITNPAKPLFVYDYTGPNGPQSMYISAGTRMLRISPTASTCLISATRQMSRSRARRQAPATTACRRRETTHMSPTRRATLLPSMSTISRTLRLSRASRPAAIRGALSLSGKYAYVTAADSTVKVIDINGTKLPAANIGSLQADIANIANNVNIAARCTRRRTQRRCERHLQPRRACGLWLDDSERPGRPQRYHH